MTPHLDEEPYRLPEPACLIRRVRIWNYKSIRHADVSLSPFTILVGRNGSGKSNFLDALHFVADSLQVSLDHAAESRGGVQSVRRAQSQSITLSIELEIALPSGNLAKYRFTLLSIQRRFVVSHEELLVRASGQGDDFMSDGTLRVTGILAAVAQLQGQQKPITLIGIEEPETSLHPAATRALMDALRDASVHAQVLVTTHSPDLLDQVEMDHESLLAVMSEDGVTHIAPLNDASLNAIRDSLFTPGGELLRLDQLDPNPKDVARQKEVLSLQSED